MDVRSTKEMKFEAEVDIGFKLMSAFENDDLVPHYVYSTHHVFSRQKKLQEIILKKMKIYGIESSILTILRMGKQKLITKETYQQVAEGKLKKDQNWADYDGSINDDLDSYFNQFLNQKVLKDEQVISFFLPKLTEKELKQVEEKDMEYMQEYLLTILGLASGNITAADVDIEEMQQSDSKDKYAHCHCVRDTINLSTKKSCCDIFCNIQCCNIKHACNMI